MKLLALTTILGLVVAGCLGSDFADSLEGSWQLTSGKIDGQEIPIIDSHPITITFEGDQVSGTASCNGYGGNFRLSGSSISLGSLAMTEMACFPEETMTAESLFADALQRVDTVGLDGALTLSGPEVELNFTALKPVPQADLTNTVWVLDGLISGDSVSSVSGERATIEFFTDGSLLGGTGCRTLAGHYQVTGADLVVTNLSASGECNPGLTDQDNHVISVMEGSLRVEITGDRLTVSTAGNEGLNYRAEA